MSKELGIRAHDFPIYDDTEKLASELYKAGIFNIQFSPKYSLKAETNNGNNMSFGLANYTKQVLNRKQINVAIFGCYVNIIHPEKKKRAEAINLFEDYLAYSKSISCPIVATETGSIIDGVPGPHEENWTNEIFETTINQIRKMIVAAEKLGVLVGIEPGINHPIHNIETTKKLIDRIDSPNLKIIFDPMNMILTPKDSELDIVKSGLKEFGNKIYAIHIKDYDFKNGKKIVVPFGDGLSPMKKIANEIKSFKPDPYILMEDTLQEHFTRSIERFKSVFG